MRVFITGIAGFLGSHLADAFLARGDQVSGVDNLIGGYAENVPSGADWLQADCNDFERLKKAMRGVEVVIHCAATAHEGLSVFSPHENARHGYAASAAVFSAACATGVRRIVFCSSMARYGKGDGDPPFHEEMRPAPEDPYGIGKLAAEKLLKNLAETHGLEWCVAVPHNIYGPRQKYDDPFRNVISIFANLMLQGRQPIIYGDGRQERCFSFFTDDIDPLVKMATENNVLGEIINIGPDEGVVTINEVAHLVADCLQFKLDPIYKPGRPREVKFAHCSAEKARDLLGYSPSVALKDGIAATVRWIRDVRGPRPFAYNHLDIEIETPQLPETWKKRLF
jgi:UDP-glucose 4-epimerase